MKHTLVIIFLILVLPSFVFSLGEPDSRWDYTGKTGPEYWGNIASSYALCHSGKRQSPIDLKETNSQIKGKLGFHYHSEPLFILNNSITLEAVFHDDDEYLIYNKQKYRLLNVHIHSPSEHFLNGRQYPMEMHMVHQDKDKHYLVLAILVKQGGKNPYLKAKFRHLPKEMHKPMEVKGSRIDPSVIIPKNKNFFSYLGSLTTPPCTEGVQWLAFETPITASKKQIELFRSRLFNNNARPIQKRNERTIILHSKEQKK